MMKKMKLFLMLLIVFLCSCIMLTACLSGASGNGSSSIENDEMDNEGSITLSVGRIELDVDEEFTLIATANPSNATVIWTVADPTVAVVENGVVKGLSNGETVVYAAIGDYVKAGCTVVVKQKLVSSYAIVLDSQETQLMVGDVFVLSASVKYGNMDITKPKFTWGSSDENVAIVSSKGVITALSAGTTVITVEYVADSGVSVKAQCKLTVIGN